MILAEDVEDVEEELEWIQESKAETKLIRIIDESRKEHMLHFVIKITR
jgi:hypothetical protein